jgi:hypothetical protein
MAPLLERIVKRNFITEIAISHRCNVIIGDYAPERQKMMKNKHKPVI